MTVVASKALNSLINSVTRWLDLKSPNLTEKIGKLRFFLEIMNLCARPELGTYRARKGISPYTKYRAAIFPLKSVFVFFITFFDNASQNYLVIFLVEVFFLSKSDGNFSEVFGSEKLLGVFNGQWLF